MGNLHPTDSDTSRKENPPKEKERELPDRGISEEHTDHGITHALCHVPSYKVHVCPAKNTLEDPLLPREVEKDRSEDHMSPTVPKDVNDGKVRG